MIATAPRASALEAALQQALLHHRAGRLSEAELLFRDILRVRPNHLRANKNLGLLLRDQGKLGEAMAVFQRVLSSMPSDAAAHSNLGSVLRLQGKLAEAEACCRQAIALEPGMALVHKNLGAVLCENGDTAESFASFRRHAELAYGTLENSARGGEPTPPHKARHDKEQRDYLNGGKAVGTGPVGMFHLEEGGRVTQRAVNPDKSLSNVAARWQSSRPKIAVIDNLLTDDALDKLRRFCWGSTIWRTAFRDGYLGAMLEDGLACPLLAQIADELRGTYPAILGQHPLLQSWGFKYDSRLSGINIHADFAAVNVNFWITPDEANRDPESGGLVVWDTPAPLDWDFAKYNDDVAAARDFLARVGARSMTVPYRANRAVIFDSDLFHETDRIAFREGYLNRRINITLLYGRREAATKESVGA